MTHRKLILTTLLILTMTTGCAGLVIRHGDNDGAKVGKITARVFLAPITLGLSEFSIWAAKDREAHMQRRAALLERMARRAPSPR